MQSLILPPAPFVTTPQFGLPRLDPDPERIPLSRPRSTHARGYSPRALPPPRLMSGSGPKDDPLDVSGHARRHRHADFPEPLATTRPETAATTVTATTATTTTAAPGPLVTPTFPTPSSSGQDKPQPPLSLHDDPSPRWPPPPYAFQGLSQPQELSIRLSLVTWPPLRRREQRPEVYRRSQRDVRKPMWPLRASIARRSTLAVMQHGHVDGVSCLGKQ